MFPYPPRYLKIRVPLLSKNALGGGCARRRSCQPSNSYPTSNPQVRVAVCGNVDAGKSTCVGVLAKHKLDDGRGSLRSLVMRYPHEVRETMLD